MTGASAVIGAVTLGDELARAGADTDLDTDLDLDSWGRDHQDCASLVDLMVPSSMTGVSTFTGAATFGGAVTLGDGATDTMTYILNP